MRKPFRLSWPKIALLAVTYDTSVKEIVRIILEMGIFRHCLWPEMVQLHDTLSSNLFLMGVTVGAAKETIFSNRRAVVPIISVVRSVRLAGILLPSLQ